MLSIGRKRRKRKIKNSKRVPEKSLVFACTSCSEPQLLTIGKSSILLHPQLKTGVCRECVIFARSAVVPVDNDGDEVYCRWCSDLGNMVYCDGCAAPFCDKCISRNVGTDYFDGIKEAEKWNCFICDPASIQAMRALTRDALNFQSFGSVSDLLVEKCTGSFTGINDVTFSEAEEIVTEKLRLRQENYSNSLKRRALSLLEDIGSNSDNDSTISDEIKSNESDIKVFKDADEFDDAKHPSPDRLSDKESPRDSPKSKLSRSHSEKTKSDKEVSPENSSEQSENEDNKMDFAEGNKKAVNMKKEDCKSTSRVTPSKKNNREDTTTSESEDQVTARKKPNSKPHLKRRAVSLLEDIGSNSDNDSAISDEIKSNESVSKARKVADESDDAKDPPPDRLSDMESSCDSPKSKLCRSHSEKTKSSFDKENSSEQSENENNKMDLAEGNKKAVNMKKEDCKSTSRVTSSKKNNREGTTTSESEDQVAARKKPNSKPHLKRRAVSLLEDIGSNSDNDSAISDEIKSNESVSKARKDADESDDAKDPPPDRLSDMESSRDSPKSKLCRSHSEKAKSAFDKENSSEQSENENNKMDLAEGNKKAVNMKKEDTATSESEDQVAARKKPNSKPRKKRRRKVR